MDATNVHGALSALAQVSELLEVSDIRRNQVSS